MRGADAGHEALNDDSLSRDGTPPTEGMDLGRVGEVLRSRDLAR